MGTKRSVPPQDKAKFLSLIQAGHSIKEASSMAGVHYNTGSRWVKRLKEAQTAREEAQARGSRGRGAGGRQTTDYQAIIDAIDLPSAIPVDQLCDEAKRGLVDFDFFRRYYLARVPSPWQVEAAERLIEMLEAEDKEFVVLNVPPGAGKSTLIHDVAVWAICRNRRIRVMIGSVSFALAKQYSRRIRETLERVQPLQPDPILVEKGLAVNAEGCLSLDYGRFKPTDKGALWRSEEFIVEQWDGNGLDNKEATVRAYGIESEFIGHRADLCLFDDVASPDNSRDSVSRDKLLERWDNVAEARCDPGGLLCVVGQRIGSGDIYAHCLSKETWDIDEEMAYDGSDVVTPEDVASVEPTKEKKYKHIIYKAYYEELDTGPASRAYKASPYPDGPLLDPKRIPWKDLSFIKQNKPDTFKVVYQQEDLDLDGRLIDRTWITGGTGLDGHEYIGCIDNDRYPGFPPPNLSHPWISIASVDPSPTMFWAVTWMIYQPESNLFYVVDIERKKMTAEQLLGYDIQTREYSGLMQEWQDRSHEMGYPISHWIVEINAAQRFLLAHDFIKKWQIRENLQIIQHTTSKNKLDENMGVETLLPNVIRTGALRFPTMRNNWKTLAAVQELTTWHRDKKKDTDIVMSLWMALLNLPNLTTIKVPPRQWRPSWLLRG